MCFKKKFYKISLISEFSYSLSPPCITSVSKYNLALLPILAVGPWYFSFILKSMNFWQLPFFLERRTFQISFGVNSWALLCFIYLYLNTFNYPCFAYLKFHIVPWERSHRWYLNTLGKSVKSGNLIGVFWVTARCMTNRNWTARQIFDRKQWEECKFKSLI